MTVKIEQKHQKRFTGKRKTSVASFREDPKVMGFLINGRKFEEYFPQERHRLKVLLPLKGLEGTTAQLSGKFKVEGGGSSGQSEAIRHAISKFLRSSPLYSQNEELMKRLKQNGFFTRDARKKERKKPGQEGARRNFQSQKR